MIKFNKHFFNFLLTLSSINLLNIYEKLKLIHKIEKLLNNVIHLFKNVNKKQVLQGKF